MVNQYINSKPLKLGSVTVLVAPYEDKTATINTATEIGMLDGAYFRYKATRKIIETDNTDDYDAGLSNETAEIGASQWKNIDLEVLHTLLQSGTYSVTNATSVNVSDESIVLMGIVPAPLAHVHIPDGVKTICQTIVVKNSTGDTTYTSGTDYVTYLADGTTYLQRLSGGSIVSGTAVSVSYTYTPIASKKFTVGGSINQAKYLHVWFVNKQADGKRFILEIYRVTGIESAELSFGSDKAKDLVTMPVAMIGRIDSSRAENDQLYNTVDEVTV